MIATDTLSISSTLQNLITHIYDALPDIPNPTEAAIRVAAALQPFLGNPTLLRPDQCQGNASHYCQHVLYVDPNDHFSIVALVWLPGQATPIHDHISWCVVGVHQGCEQEVQYRQIDTTGGPALLPKGTCCNPAGSVAALTPPGDIHHVANPGPDLAISLHIYGANIARLGSSIRRRYNLPVLTEAPTS
jgi:predicted metal-dependent enzyme (double-stranded beta helix superfamily)